MARTRTELICKKCSKRYFLEHAVDIAKMKRSKIVKCPNCGKRIGITN